MRDDEQQIRDLVATWMEATRRGEVERILELVTDDVVFLVPGRQPMRRDEFAALARAQASPGGPAIDGTGEVQEVQLLGDWAFMRTRLTVTATPPDGTPPVTREGHTLTVLRRDGGRWRIARDANVMAPAKA